MIELEPMHFREAMRYGFDERKLHKSELRYIEEHGPQLPAGFQPNVIVPSTLATDPIVTPELKRVTEVLYNQRLRATGEPYDEELLAEDELRREQRDRFLASRWSRLFPRIVNMPARTVVADF